MHLSDVLKQEGMEASYIYDFGDNWEHSLILEKVLIAELGALYPACIDGERNSPPEGCGGIGGFSDFLEAIRDPSHEEHEETLEWIGDDFDPEAFSIRHINQRLVNLPPDR